MREQEKGSRMDRLIKENKAICEPSLTCPHTENTQALIKDYKARLRDLENNIWQY